MNFCNVILLKLMYKYIHNTHKIAHILKFSIKRAKIRFNKNKNSVYIIVYQYVVNIWFDFFKKKWYNLS